MSGLPDADKLALLIDDLATAAGTETDTAIQHRRAQERVTALRRELREWLDTYRREQRA